MTNAEYFLKDGVSVEEFCAAIDNFIKGNGYSARVSREFLNAIYKPITPTLTEDERVILKPIVANHKTIFRDKGGDLWTRDTDDEDWTFYQFNHLFQFIKNGEEYEISELLGDDK